MNNNNLLKEISKLLCFKRKHERMSEKFVKLFEKIIIYYQNKNMSNFFFSQNKKTKMHEIIKIKETS